MEVKCNNCGKENREIAKFCRFCGSQIEVKVDENEVKYVEFYVIIRVYGQTIKIRCMIYLADSPDAGE